MIEELNQLLERTGFFWDWYDSTTVTFHPLVEASAYYDYFRFQWFCELIQPGIVDITADLFGHFRDSPHHLAALPPRSLEVLLDAAFRSQGFRTELGPGSSDGGVDIRIYQHDAIGELQTLVQIKRYAQRHPIRLDAVAALRAMVADQKANRGLFVTTSRYLPGVRRFAERQGHVIQLADTSDMVRWCEEAERAVTMAVDLSWVELLCDEVRQGRTRGGLVGRVAHTTWGYNTTINDFALIIRDTPGAALLAPLKARVVRDDGHGQVGEEVPEYTLKVRDGTPRVFLARKKRDGSSVTLWGRKRLYSLWDGSPKPFNYMD
jgi:hypothetical protein